MTEDENDELYADEIEEDIHYYESRGFTDEYQRCMWDYGLKESDFG